MAVVHQTGLLNRRKALNQHELFAMLNLSGSSLQRTTRKIHNPDGVRTQREGGRIKLLMAGSELFRLRGMIREGSWPGGVFQRQRCSAALTESGVRSYSESRGGGRWTKRETVKLRSTP